MNGVVLSISGGTDITESNDGQFIQYIADNADHNTRTIDGKDTFHGMGMIAAVTPGMKQIHKLVPRVNVTTEDITSIGHVSIKHFKPQGDNFRLLSYKGPHLFMLMIQHHLLTHCGKDPCPFRPRGLVGLE